MRKLLLSLSILFAFSLVANAQCTPNPIFTMSPIPGVYPPNIPIPGIPLTGISDGQVNVPYSQTLTLIVLEDTSLDVGLLLPTAVVTAMSLAGISTVMTVGVNHVIYDITGLPSNLSYVCDSSTCQYPSGADGCMQINGVPIQAGTFPIDVNMTINIQIPAITTLFAGMAVDFPTFPGQQYYLFINGSSGVEVQKIEKFTMYPNPTSDIAILEFDGKKDVKVLDNLGRIIVTQKNVNSKLKLSKEQLGTGLFIIEIADENKIWKEKLIIN